MGAAAAGAVALALAACGGGDGDLAGEPGPELSASPLVEPTPDPTPAATPSPTPSASPSPSPASPSPTATDGDASVDPGDTERGRFVADHRPEGASDLEHVAVDLDGDEVEELVFAYVTAGGTSRIDVAWWDGRTYAVGYRGDGGPADEVERLRVADVNADGATEVVTFQSAGEAGSLTLWQVVEGRRLVGLRAHGGCADGSHTYGVVGAELADRDGDGAAEVYATCDDSPLPRSAWRTDTYVWRDGAYRVARATG